MFISKSLRIFISTQNYEKPASDHGIESQYFASITTYSAIRGLEESVSIQWNEVSQLRRVPCVHVIKLACRFCKHFAT
jgi:hypothetical protein